MAGLDEDIQVPSKRIWIMLKTMRYGVVEFLAVPRLGNVFDSVPYSVAFRFGTVG
ncbi:MAG: hypothetical protein ABSG79_03535 [Bryobacteraceae bacterium]